MEVRGLDFRGNRALSDDDLSLRVATTPSSFVRRWLRFGGTKRCLNLRALPRDVVGLRQYYRDRGFYDARVEAQVDTLGPASVRVIFNVTEGPPTLVTFYQFLGLEGLADSAGIIRRLRLRVGDRWDLGLFQADVDSIVSRLRNQGYYRASILQDSVAHSPATREAYARLIVIPGKQARFGDADPDVSPAPGRAQQISDETVKRLLGIRAGQLFSDNAIRDAQRNLFQLATYRQVEVQPRLIADQPSDTVVLYDVRLTEDLMRQLDTEFGWATLDCFRTRLQLVDKNAFRSARRLELTASATKLGYGYPLKTDPTREFCKVNIANQPGIAQDQFSDSVHYFLGATLRQPRLLGTRVVPSLSVYSERRGEFQAYLRHTHIGGDVSATRDVADRTPLRLGYSIEYGKTDAPAAAMCALFNRCDVDSRAFLTRLRPLGIASLGISRVRTDNPFSPTRGTTFRAELRSAQPFLFTPDSQSFNKATGDLAHYAPIGRNVLALRLRGGVVLGRKFEVSSGTDFIPPQERLYAGGPTSVRGFQQNELGQVVYIARTREVAIDTTFPIPSDTLYHFEASTNSNPERTVPLGGNSLLVANVEFRTRIPFLLPDLLQFTGFVDGGDVWSRGGTFQMKWTPGIGVRASTPIGPVQVNIAQNRPLRENGPLFYNPDVSALACATPGNALTYRRVAGELVQANTGGCEDFGPPQRRGFRRLTFTFSIGSDV